MVDIPILIAIAIPTGGGLIAWGALKQEQKDLRADVDTKAPREVVDAQYDAILQRLERIERKIDSGNGKHP